MSNMQCQLKAEDSSHSGTYHNMRHKRGLSSAGNAVSQNWHATPQHKNPKKHIRSESTCMIPPHLKWCRMLLRARPSAQLVVKFSTLTSGCERVHWRTQLSKIFSLLVCCRLDMISFMMSFTYMNMEKHALILVNKQEQKRFDSISLPGFI